MLLAATVFPVVQQSGQLSAQLLQRGELGLDFAHFDSDRGLEISAGAHTRTPRFEDASPVGQGDLHRLEGADQRKLGVNLLAKQAIAALRTTDRHDQTFIAIEANGFDRQTGALGDLADFLAGLKAGARGADNHLTLHPGETSL